MEWKSGLEHQALELTSCGEVVQIPSIGQAPSQKCENLNSLLNNERTDIKKGTHFVLAEK